MMRENIRKAAPGGLVFVLLVAAAGAGFAAIGAGAHGARWISAVGGTVLALVMVCLGGFFTVGPNEGRVLQLFGRYVGTVRVPGLRWVVPFLTRRRVSLRVHSFESGKLKVNDLDGNPIEIAAVVVWRVIDTAQACFEVEEVNAFVRTQAESALRNTATHYAYDAHDDAQLSLRGSTDVIAAKLKDEIQARLEQAGVEVVEARIAHLAYAPEIAQAMLQRQQASAIVAARQRIVDGAVGMVEMALERLEKSDVVELDAERRAAMVSNLLVVLCGERSTQPVINAGTIYQ